MLQQVLGEWGLGGLQVPGVLQGRRPGVAAAHELLVAVWQHQQQRIAAHGAGALMAALPHAAASPGGTTGTRARSW